MSSPWCDGFLCFARNDGKAYRPTITPITFGAARYFSSILTCNNRVFALACSASASASGDCRRSRESIASIQRGSGRAGSRHLAAGSCLRLRACRCRSGNCQCRRADGRGLYGSRSRDRLGDGRAINGDGLGHRVRSCCVAPGYSDCSVSVKAVSTATPML
jgi:hypothetical protein